MKLRTLADLDLDNKTVLLRVDYNVPLQDGKIADPLRIQESLPTIRELLKHDCKIVLISHLGRPDGKVDPALSLRPIAAKLQELLGQPIAFATDCIGKVAHEAVSALQSGGIVLLENLRFHAAEEANDPAFAKQLAELADVYIDDAFAVVHRAHASTVGVAELLPSAAGLLVQKEVEQLSGALEHPTRPLVAVIAGAKVSTKIEVISNLMKYVNKLVIGGAMANTFLAADGLQVGKSLVEPEFYETVHRIKAEAEAAGVELVLPEDVIVTKDPKVDAPGHLVEAAHAAADDWIVDLGPRTVAAIVNPVDFHGTIIWNGPLGITEVPAFAHGSQILAQSIIDSDAISIIGGGDTAAFIDRAGLHDKFTLVSTGGGSSLELLAGRELPGLVALQAVS